MDLAEGIQRSWTRLGRLLAFFAVLFLTFNPHHLHAHSDKVDGHSHFGQICDIPDADKSLSGGGDPLDPHGDCLHHFVPLLQPSQLHEQIGINAGLRIPYTDSNRQAVLTADPPPPRNLS